MQRKIHNQTLFVAALSVYLGLLIVGAPPQVSAQISPQTLQEILQRNENFRRVSQECSKIHSRERTKSFIEGGTLTLSADDYIAALIGLIRHSESTSPQGFAFRGWVTHPDSLASHIIVSHWQKPVSKGTFVNNVLSAHSESKSNLLAHKPEGSGIYLQLDFEVDKNIVSSVAQDKQNSVEQAQETASLFNTALQSALIAKRQAPQATALENTKVSIENNQVLIVTRLPRANLDALLEADEKAN